MSGTDALYGGDDVGALIFDPGNYSLRVGYAEEASPRAEIPSVVGIVSNTNNGSNINNANMDLETKTDNNITSNDNGRRTYYIDTNYVNVPRANMEIETYMKDSMIENWDLFEKVLDYAYAKVVQCESEYHPILFSEPSWNVKNNREKLAEIMFEKYNVPAFFLVKNALLTAYANGRSTTLVVDSGASHTSVVPVLNGYVLTKNVIKSPLGGDDLLMKCRNHLETIGVNLMPIYKIGSKEVVKECEAPRFTLRTLPENLTQSWQDYMLKLLLHDFRLNVLEVSETPYVEETASKLPIVHYEFPNGYNQYFGPERFQLTESLFDHPFFGAGQLTALCVAMCDVDIRLTLYNSIVLTGGNTLFQGYPDRLLRDIQLHGPTNVRVKILSANNSLERRFSAWIGGSIVTSAGTFQQMWISAQQYEELVVGIYEKGFVYSY